MNDFTRFQHHVRKCAEMWPEGFESEIQRVGDHVVQAVLRRNRDGKPCTTWYLDYKRRGLGEVRRIVEGRMQ